MKLYIQIMLHVVVLFPVLLIALLAAALLLIPGLFCGCDDIKRYNTNVMVALDQTFNAVLGGDEDETISSRAGKRQKTQKWAKYLCKFLNLLDKGHCDKYIEKDEGSNQVIDD